MNMDLSTVRVALYAANVGKNIHMLRVPTMKHVFIGHGDSDKLASVNPFSKVYDEVWTAGRAGRDRYAIADVGVRDDDIVEVGRPQLAPIQNRQDAPPAPARPPTDTARPCCTRPPGRAGTATRATPRSCSPARTSSRSW